jgi:hypothetical protein
MIDDSIVEEVRHNRQEYARKFNYDAKAILADLARRAEKHEDRLVSFPPRPARKRKTA